MKSISLKIIVRERFSDYQILQTMTNPEKVSRFMNEIFKNL